jgi:hypothetical protein
MLAHYLSRSPPARAILSILRQVRRSGCGGLTVPGLVFLLRRRHAPSTIEHAALELIRLRAVVWTGAKTRTRQGGRACVWTAIDAPK